jgi:UDP-2-acetamido-2-deoxy-ribo-hexuluronate aminotransferase
MDTLQCAIVLAKLERFDWEVEQRIRIGQRYTDLITPLRGVSGAEATRPVTIRSDRTSVYAQYTLICSDRESVQEELKKAEIPTAVHYPVPLNEQAAYRELCCPDCTPISSRLAKRVLSLPLSSDLSSLDQDLIVNTLTKAVA